MKKLRSRRGVTLTEMLVAMAVASLVALAVAAGVTSAISVYHQSVEFSETQVLCSTLAQAVSDELRYARDVKTEGDVTTFTSDIYGESCTFAVNDKGQLAMQSGADDPVLLVGSGAYSGESFQAQVEELTYTDGDRTFHAKLTIQNKNGEALKTVDLTVETLN